MRNYEITYIVHPDLDDSAFKKLNDLIGSWIKDGGGKITKSDVWGKRKMAYAIRKQDQGQYVLLQVEMDPSFGSELERQLGLQESVLRYLIVAVEAEDEAELPVE
jgi:small subunit ribosomal protein S6